jgi:chromosomal replication initiator protein
MNYFTFPGILKVDINPENLFNAIEKVTGISKEVLCSPARQRPIVEARYIFAYIIRKKTNLSLVEIGNLIKKNHCSIIFYNKQMDWFIKSDPNIINLYKKTLNQLC